MKNKKNGELENMFIRISPFSAKQTKTILVVLSIVNLVASGMIFIETIQKERGSEYLSQTFIERVNNTRSIK
jgi:hypothetical protein